MLRLQVTRFERVLAEPGWEPQAMVEAAQAVHEDLIKMLVVRDSAAIDALVGRLASWRWRKRVTEDLLDAADTLEYREAAAARGDRHPTEAEMADWEQHAWLEPLLKQHAQAAQEERDALQQMDKDDLRLWALSESSRISAAVWMLTESRLFDRLKEPVGSVLLSGSTPCEPRDYLTEMDLDLSEIHVGLSVWHLAGMGTRDAVGRLVERLDREHRSLFVRAIQMLAEQADHEEED